MKRPLITIRFPARRRWDRTGESLSLRIRVTAFHGERLSRRGGAHACFAALKGCSGIGDVRPVARVDASGAAN